MTLTLMRLRLVLTTAEIDYGVCVLSDSYLVFSYSLPLSHPQDLHELPVRYPHYPPCAAPIYHPAGMMDLVPLDPIDTLDLLSGAGQTPKVRPRFTMYVAISRS
jgi:hypothetical protein